MTNKEKYRLFCREVPELPLFWKDWYLDAVCTDGEWEVALVEHNGKIMASMPYFVKRKFFMRYATMPLFTKYLGPYLRPDPWVMRKGHLLIQALAEQLPPLDYFVQHFSPAVTNWLPFCWQGYQQTTLYTYVMQGLSELEKVYDSIKQDRRREIRKAKATLNISRQHPLEIFYDVHKGSFDRQGARVPFTFEALSRLDEVLAMNNARQVFFAEDSTGVIHGACYLMWDTCRSYFQFLGSQPGLRSSAASSLLTWEAIRFTSEELGLEEFDFQGSMMKAVEPVIRSFGANQRPYFKVWKYGNILTRVWGALQ